MIIALIIIAILLLYSVFISMKYYQDKTKTVAKMQEMKQKDQEMELILRNVNAYFLLINRDFIVQRTNYYLLNGIPEENTVKRVGDLLHCKNAMVSGQCGTDVHCQLCGIRATIAQAFHQERDFDQAESSMNILSRDGQQITLCEVSVSGRYLKTDDQEQMMLTVYDISELRHMERLWRIEKENALSCERLKATFIANMSHEVRTPLNAIIGFSGLLATTSDEDEKQMYIDIINSNNERLLQIINDILDLSQIEVGAVEFAYSEFDVYELLYELKPLFDIRLRDKPEVTLICDAGVQSLTMYSEKRRITQVLVSLMNNAVKFTQSGTIHFGCRLKNEREVYFYISDTGVGIPKEEKDKIFSRFTKLDRETPGTGLGLTLSLTIVEKLGGEIGVDSTLNQGSNFWFSLPLQAN